MDCKSCEIEFQMYTWIGAPDLLSSEITKSSVLVVAARPVVCAALQLSGCGEEDEGVIFGWWLPIGLGRGFGCGSIYEGDCRVILKGGERFRKKWRRKRIGKGYVFECESEVGCMSGLFAGLSGERCSCEMERSGRDQI